MAVIAELDVFEVRYVTSVANQVGLNVRHYVAFNVVGTPTDLQVIPVIALNVAPEYKALMISSATYVGADIRRVTPTATPPISSTNGQGPGEVVGDMLPTQVCGLIKLQADPPGPAGRGRAYIPFPGETDSDGDGKPLPGYITKLDALGAKFTTDVLFDDGAGNSVELVNGILHRAIPPELSTFDIIRQAVSRPSWATQRRRGAFGAPNTPPF